MLLDLLCGIEMNLDKYKGMEKDGFLFEIQRLAAEMDSLIDEYGVRDEVMSLFVVGVIEPSEGPDPEVSQLRAIYGYNVNSREELEELLNFASDTYKDPESPDINDLLDGLGISLN